jgi:hypothetical protein
MNHIHALQLQNEALTKKMDNAMTEIFYLQRYLLSTKFYTDTTVQVSDVLNRIEDIRNELQGV